MELAVLALTKGGYELGEKIADRLESCTLIRKKDGQKTAGLLAELWRKYDGFICIMATGIVVRSIAPLLNDKLHDPCVVVLDEKGRNVVSLLSGHMGGGNELTCKVAASIGANPVITTASDTLQLVALDIWAAKNNLVVPNRRVLTSLAARLVNNGLVKLYADVDIGSLPPGLHPVDKPASADLVVSHRIYKDPDPVYLRPRNLVIGTGCNRGTPSEEFEAALAELLDDLRLSVLSIRNVASIDKKNDESGLLQFAASHGWTIDFFDKAALNSKKKLEISFAALKAVGAIGVAEPASLLSADSNLLLCRKRKWKNITMAVAQVPFTLSAQDRVPQNS